MRWQVSPYSRISFQQKKNSGRPPLLSSLCLCLFLVQLGERTAAVPIGEPSTSLTKACCCLLCKPARGEDGSSSYRGTPQPPREPLLLLARQPVGYLQPPFPATHCPWVSTPPIKVARTRLRSKGKLALLQIPLRTLHSPLSLVPSIRPGRGRTFLCG